jgi:hypothetical protein
MRTKPPPSFVKRQSQSDRLDTVQIAPEESSSARAQRKYAVNIQHITDALVLAGYRTLDAQAQALGIHRATVWTIINNKHKLGRLNQKTTERMLANPDLPPSVRSIVAQYMAERRPRASFTGDQRNSAIMGSASCDRENERKKRGRLLS